MPAPKGDKRDKAQLCTAHRSRDNAPCKAYAIRGHHVCAAHGGKSPQVRKSAREYLASQAYLSATVLVKIRDNPDALLADRVRAATAILDRSGYGPGSKLEVHRTTDLRPRVLDMLNATPPPLSEAAKGAVTSITTLPAPVNRSPKAKAQS